MSISENARSRLTYTRNYISEVEGIGRIEGEYHPINVEMVFLLGGIQQTPGEGELAKLDNP